MDKDNFDDRFSGSSYGGKDLPRPTASSKAPLFMALGGGALVLIVLGVAAFIWPGFARRAGLADDLLRLAPADSVFAVGFNVTTARKHETFKKMLDEVEKKLKEESKVPEEVVKIFGDADRLMIAGTVRGEKTPVIIIALHTLKPYDQDKIKKISELEAAETDQGVTFQRIKVGSKDPTSKDVYLAMPDPKVLVVGAMPKEDFVKCLKNRTSKPVASADLLAACRRNDNTMVWVGVANDGELKKGLDKLTAKGPKELTTIAAAKSLGFSLDLLVKEGMKVEVNVHYAKPAEAEALRNPSMTAGPKPQKRPTSISRMLQNWRIRIRNFTKTSRNRSR